MAITTRLLHLRPTPRPYPLSFHHHFSTSSSDDPQPPQPDPKTPPENQIKNPPNSFSSYFNDAKSPLKNQQQPPPQPKTPLFDEIRRNLSEYRQGVTPPPPSSNTVSFQQVYNNTKAPPGESPPKLISMADRVRQMTNPGAGGGDSSYVNRFKSMGQNASGGGTSFTFPTFNLRDKKDVDGTKFFKSHKHSDLGKKLQSMRPQNREGKWFSLQELSDRFTRMKEIEEKESLERGGIHLKGLRESLRTLQEADITNDKLKIVRKLEHLRNLGGTPSYMLHPPKEELVEQYFHPDNMSSAEKMKLELKKVRDEFKMSESDCGSTRVQIAQLTTKIKHLSSVLAKKDKHSRKGLLAMVQQRKKLLKYLRRTDWESYSLVLSKLGLRDNPDVKA